MNLKVNIKIGKTVKMQLINWQPLTRARVGGGGGPGGGGGGGTGIFLFTLYALQAVPWRKDNTRAQLVMAKFN